MLRSKIFKNFVSSQHKRCIIFRAMATKLKDYVSYYDILEIHPECTKVRKENLFIVTLKPLFIFRLKSEKHG